jgi:hypothetical protein
MPIPSRQYLAPKTRTFLEFLSTTVHASRSRKIIPGRIRNRTGTPDLGYCFSNSNLTSVAVGTRIGSVSIRKWMKGLRASQDDSSTEGAIGLRG